MKAVVADGSAAVLERSRPPPRLRDDCILIKVVAVALNPTDWKHLYSNLVPPGCLLGCDFAGYIEAIGSAVTKQWSKGDRVAGVVHGGNPAKSEDGAFAEYIVAKGDICLKLPEYMSFEDAATLPLSVFTVMQGLYQKGLNLQLPSDASKEKESVLIYGGSTAAGALGIQFAKL
jgi:NADPH:quinone reductase-like Zn-dependent oxidoreductase